MDSVPTAVIVLAAGQGTRMKSQLPKVLHPLAGVPMLGHVLKSGAFLKPNFLCAVVRHQREKVVQYLQDAFPSVIVADQDEVPGTGRAVQCALNQLGRQGFSPQVGGQPSTVLVTSGDAPLLAPETLQDLFEYHVQQDAQVTILAPKLPDPTGYGRVVRDEEGRVVRIVEHKDASPKQLEICEVNAGTYVFDAQFLQDALANLDQDNAQGELYLTDTIAQAAAQNRAHALTLDDYRQTEGCNDRIQLAALHAEYNRRQLEKWMRQGVTIQDPATTWIGGEVQLESDVTVLPGTNLSGKTSVGTGSLIGPYTSLNNVKVASDAKVRHSDLDNIQVRSGEIWRLNQLDSSSDR